MKTLSGSESDLAAQVQNIAADPFRLISDGSPSDSLRTQFPGLYIKFRSFKNASNEFAAMGTADRTSTIAHGHALWEELGDPEGAYRIPIPNIQFVIGHEPNEQLEPPYLGHRPEEKKPGYYTIAEKVIGEPLDEALINPRSSIEMDEVDSVYATLGRYYLNKLRNGGDFVTDMKVEQFMYGHLANKPGKEGVILVDREPFYSGAIENDPDGSGFSSLRSQAHRLANMVFRAQVERGGKLIRSKPAVLDLLHSLPTYPSSNSYSSRARSNPTEELIEMCNKL